MSKNKTQRLSYSIDFNVAQKLGMKSMEMSSEIGQSVARQDILDILVGIFARDKKIYNRVKKEIEKRNK